MTRAMAAHHGIRINCVAPGTAFTPMAVGEGMPHCTASQEKSRTAED